MTRIRWHILMYLALFTTALPLSLALDFLGVPEPAKFLMLIVMLSVVSFFIRTLFPKPPKGVKKSKPVDGGLNIPMYPPRADIEGRARDEAYFTEVEEWRRRIEAAKQQEDEEQQK